MFFISRKQACCAPRKLPGSNPTLTIIGHQWQRLQQQVYTKHRGFNMKHWKIDMKHWKFDMKHWIFNLKHWKFNMKRWRFIMKHRRSDMKHWRFNMKYWTFNTKQWRFDIKHWRFNTKIQYETLKVRYETLNLLSCFKQYQTTLEAVVCYVRTKHKSRQLHGASKVACLFSAAFCSTRLKECL